MITQQQLNAISELNRFMNSREDFRAAISNDTTIRNEYNITRCIKSVELYNYLYRHNEIIIDTFKIDSRGFIDRYLGNEIFLYLLRLMCNNQFTASQALKELKRFRSSTDYRGELG